MKNILVTGACGMIGSALVKGLTDAGYAVVGVDRMAQTRTEGKLQYVQADLADQKQLEEIIAKYPVDRVIHLAALAHKGGESDLSWERYRHVNAECARNVFMAAGSRPVLHISTVDVYGFYDGKAPVDGETPLHPVTFYGKSKALAEEACRELPHFSIFRFSPVYTPTQKRDIQKRYYLKYPNVAYKVGKGTEFEILSIENAVQAMVNWCACEPCNNITVIRDPERMNTADYIRREKAEGRAKTVLYFPRWMVRTGYHVLKAVLGENDKTYLLNKAVYPLRSK